MRCQARTQPQLHSMPESPPLQEIQDFTSRSGVHAPVAEVFEHHGSDYTREWLDAIPGRHVPPGPTETARGLHDA